MRYGERSWAGVRRFLAPTAFMDTWITPLVLMPIRQGRSVTLVGNGTRRHAFIALQDVVAFIQAALEHPAAHCRRLVVGGPAALSLREVVAICEQVLGRPIPVEQVAPDEPISGLRQEAWPIAAGFDAFDASLEMAETARTFGIALTPLEAFVRRQLAEMRTEWKERSLIMLSLVVIGLAAHHGGWMLAQKGG